MVVTGYLHTEHNKKQKKWTQGYDTVLVGHYHQTKIDTCDTKKLIFMGDWLKHFTVTLLDKNGWNQFKWN